jgi:thiosulfate/3-mercaptopyruvate sulfurtransferase
VTHRFFESLPDSPLVTSDWLAAHCGSDNLVVLDATVLVVPGFNGRSAYLRGDERYLVAGHIPGAVFADVMEVFSDPEGEHPFTRPSRRQFERAARAVGVDSDTAVVVYDNAVGQWASRLWWLFRAFGYHDVRVLDGGLQKWVAEGRAVDTGRVAPRHAGQFCAEADDDVWADEAFVQGVLEGEHPATLICGISPKEFVGAEGNRPRLGHIPGSRSVPAVRLVDPETNAYLSPERLREVFGAEVVESGEPIVAYCAGGIAATSDALALALLGRTDVRVYDGSLTEWAADPALPLV